MKNKHGIRVIRRTIQMFKKHLANIFIVTSLSIALEIIVFQQVHAQVQGTEIQQIKWLSTGALRSWFSNMGAEIEYGRRNRQTYIAVDQIDGLCWPNEFNIRMKGVKAAKSLWIGSSNFTDPVSTATYPYKVVCIGKDAIHSGTEVFADELTLSGKFPHPSVYVDGVSASVRDYDDILDKEDNTLPADRVLVNNFHTSIGVSVTRKILSFTQQYNDNYYIYEYTFKNTGIIDESGQKKLTDTLTEVIFYMQSKLAFPGVSYTGIGITGAGGWAPATTTWGRNTITDVIRKDDSNPDEFRANFSYYGPMSTTPYGSPAGDIGLPGPTQINVTELAGYEFAGTVILHADKSATDPADDITQPTTTMYAGADNIIDRNNQPTQYNANLMAQKYSQFMTAGHASATIADQVGKDANGWPTGYANTFGTDAGGYLSTQGFGPYTLIPGGSVRIVVAEAVAGISWNKACEVAKNWFAVRTGISNPQLVLPEGYKNGAVTTDANEYKNAWVFSGKDSLFQTFRRAIANYNSGYHIPLPPPPPDTFIVNSSGYRIKISWSNSAESSPHFDGYRLYRSEDKTDTTYDLIFECGKSTGNLVNSYEDQSAKGGFSYYYYIQSKDDGSTNPGDAALNIPAGEPLVSSRYYTMTNIGVPLYVFTAGIIQSHQSGDWNDVKSWERFNGSVWVYPAPNIPTDSSDAILIQTGHTITISTADSVDQLTVALGGALTINTGATLRIKNGTGTDLAIKGTLTNSGTIIESDSSTIIFWDRSSYMHKRNGGSIPIASWASGSTCEITDIIDTVPFNTNQNFGSFVWNCPGQSANVNLNWQGRSINSLTVKNTNWNHVSTSDPSYHLDLCSDQGQCWIHNLSINGYHAALETQSGAFINTINISNIMVSSGGLLVLSNDSGTSTYLCNGNFSIPDSGYIGIGSPSSQATIIFSGSGTYITPSTGFTYLGGPNFVIGTMATLSVGNSVFAGSGNFTVDIGATIATSHPEGLDGNVKVTGTKVFTQNTHYIFNSITGQVTGSLMPDTIGNLTINNNSGVTLSRSVDVNGTLEMKNGMLSIGSHRISYGNNSSLRYSGTAQQTTTNAEFPSVNGPRNLDINNSNGVTLHETRAINGSMSLAGKLIIGTNTIMAATATSADSNSYVLTEGESVLKLSSIGTSSALFPIGTKSGYAPVWITNSGTIDTISVNVVDDAGKAVGGGRVKLKWNISKNSPGNGVYNLRFGWLTSLTDSVFKVSTVSSRKIFRLSDTAEAGTGYYARGVDALGRGGITVLGAFTVGNFTSLTDLKEYTRIIPLEFNLEQNFPNPFNPSTTISFGLPKKSQVSLKIYDLLGREIATLVNNEEMPAGSYLKEFNARHLTSGVYFYRLQAGQYTETKKLVLMK